MAKAVVDLLEMVKVQHHQRRVTLHAQRAADFDFSQVHETAA